MINYDLQQSDETSLLVRYLFCLCANSRQTFNPHGLRSLQNLSPLLFYKKGGPASTVPPLFGLEMLYSNILHARAFIRPDNISTR